MGVAWLPSLPEFSPVLIHNLISWVISDIYLSRSEYTVRGLLRITNYIWHDAYMPNGIFAWLKTCENG